MLEITILVAVVLVVLAVPSLRQAAFSFLGLIAIIVAGAAIVAVVVWALYQAKPWMTPDAPSVAEAAKTPGGTGSAQGVTPEAALTSALESEEAERLKIEREALEAERLRIAAIAERARVVLNEDRVLAERAASFPLPTGTGVGLGNIIAIRVPAWRNQDLAAIQKEAIRAWLVSIGLPVEETTSITTVKAWGLLYDMWIAENRGNAPPGFRFPTPATASAPGEADPATGLDPLSPEESGLDPLLEDESESLAETEQEPLPEDEVAPEPESPPVEPRSFSPPAFARPVPPRRAEIPRAPPLRRPSPAQPAVGPFGY